MAKVGREYCSKPKGFVMTSHSKPKRFAITIHPYVPLFTRFLVYFMFWLWAHRGLAKKFKCLRMSWLKVKAYFFIRTHMVFMISTSVVIGFFYFFISRFTKSHRETDKWDHPSPSGGRSPDNRDYSTNVQCLSKRCAEMYMYIDMDMATVISVFKLWQIATTTTGC